MKCGLPPNFFQPTTQPTTCDALCNFRVFWQSPRTTKKKLYPIVLLLPGVLTPNVPTRRHAKRESLRTAAMSFKKEYFVRGSFQSTPLRMKNGRKSSRSFKDG